MRTQIRSALASARTIAVVGCSPNPERPSNAIARYLLEQGYRVIPVNPGHRQILGETCYRSLSEIPSDVAIDIVDVFRQVRPRGAGGGAGDRPRAPGSSSCSRGWSTPVRRRRLEAAGIPVAMDRCILVEHASRGVSRRNFDGPGKR